MSTSGQVQEHPDIDDGGPGPEAPPPPSSRGRRRRTRLIALITAVAVVALAGLGTGLWFAFGRGGSSSAADAPTPKVTTKTVAVTTGTIRQTVSSSGTLEPSSESDADFAVSGQVTAVDVAGGQTVTAGQTLATIDPTALQYQLEEATETLASAQAKLASDQADSASTSQIDADESSVTSDQASLTTAQDDRNDATLTAPIAGTVASVGLTVGEEVSGTGSSGSSSSGSSSDSSSTSGGSTGSSTAATSTSSSGSSSGSSGAVTIIDTGAFTVSATVDDTQISSVKVGDTVDITPSGSSTSGTYTGTVTAVGLVASSSSDVASFPVTIALTGDTSGLYAGSTVTADIIVKQLNDVVEVPTAAISYAGGSAQVTVVDGGSTSTRAVTTGSSEGDVTQVVSGLTAGEKVQERTVSFSGAGRSGSRSLFGSTGRGSSEGGFPSGGPGGFGGSGGSGGFGGGAGGFGGGSNG